MANYYSPEETTSNFAASAIYKKNLSLFKFMLIALLGGAFIAFGGLLSVMVAGGMPGGVGGESNPA